MVVSGYMLNGKREKRRNVRDKRVKNNKKDNEMINE